MKRYGYLYDDVCDIDNIRLAHKNASRGKLHYEEVKLVNLHEYAHLHALQCELVDKVFCTSAYTTFTVNDNGKCREIYKLPYYPDRIVHHCIMQIIEHIWVNVFISDTYSSIKNRGIHKGMDRIKLALQDRENTKYCLKIDVRKFYPSIDHDILKSIIRMKLKDPELLQLLYEIIDSANGVPIGNYLSQYFGNLYLTYFDHWMKEHLHCKYYFRYCDDIVILHSNKAFLHEVLHKAVEYLDNNLKLYINDNYAIFPTDSRGIDFLGYVFYYDYTCVRKSIANRFKKRMQYIKTHWTSMTAVQIVSSVMSYYGWLKHCNCINLMNTYIDNDIKYILQTVCFANNMQNPLRRMAWL